MPRIEPILSRDEVQALLESAQSRPPSPSRGALAVSLRAEPVDLLADDRPLRLLVPPLQVGFARLAESLRRILTSVLRSKVEIRNETPEILNGRGLATVAEKVACLLVLRMTIPGHDSQFAVLALDPLFTFSVIERLFGGGGSPPQMPEGRSPTALERRMLIRAMQPVVDALNETFEPPGFYRFEIVRAEGRLDLVPGYTPDTTSLHVPFTMSIGERFASLALTLPAAALEPLRGRIGVPKADSSAANAMPEAMRDVAVAVSVELGSVRLTLRQILTLTPGTVLALDRNRSDDLPVLVEGRPKFIGTPVQDDGAIAVEITGRLSDAKAG